MAITLVQKKTLAASANGTSFDVVLDSAPTEGNLLVGFVHARNQTGAGDISFGTGWAAAIEAINGALGGIHYKVAGAGESATITVTLAVAASPSIVVAEYSGLLTNSVLDQTASASSGNPGDTESQTTGTTATTAQDDELLVGMVGIRRTNGATSGFSATNSFNLQDDLHPTGAGEKSDLAWADRIVAATGTFETTFSWTTAYRTTGAIATFKGAEVTAGSPWYAYAQQ